MLSGSAIVVPSKPMTPAQMRLGRRRLWLGITNVGFWVLAACAGLSWLVIGRVAAPGVRLLLVLGTGAVAVQGTFDVIGGLMLMPGPRPSLMAFLLRWSRGVLGHTLVLTGVGIVSTISLRLTGGFGAGIGLAMWALALSRRPLLRAIGGVASTELTHDGARMLTVAVDDPAFTGGIVGLGGGARSLLPASWLATLPRQELDAELSRRRWEITNALPARAFALILLWSLLGTFTGTHIFHLAERTPAVALLGHACWMTLWAFAGLLVLPSASRQAVFAADRAATESGHDPRAWITRFPDLVGEDGSPNNAVQTIFYPVPSAERRLGRLGRPTTGLIPGNLARNNLYYSWATFTLLGRAVHCNAGRPALWVFPPSA